MGGDPADREGAPDLRVGDLRGRRHDPRPDHPGHRADRRETLLTPLAHLTCVGHSVGELRNVVGSLSAAGLRNILALRGDPQGGAGQPWVRHPEGVDHADELVSLVRSLGDFTVGVAAFPDQHPSARPRAWTPRSWSARPRGCGVRDHPVLLRPRPLPGAAGPARAPRGADLPVVPAIMPITNARQVVRMAAARGSADADRRHRPAGGHGGRRRRRCGPRAWPSRPSSRRLLDEGAPGIHFITMNRSTATLEVFGNLGIAAAR